jgi:hypothetical protein
MGRPHPSHSINEPHPTVHKIARATRIKIPTYGILADEKSMFADEGVDRSSHRIRAFVCGFESSQ